MMTSLFFNNFSAPSVPPRQKPKPVTKSDSRTTIYSQTQPTFGATSFPNHKSHCLWDKKVRHKSFAVSINRATNINFSNDTKVSAKIDLFFNVFAAPSVPPKTVGMLPKTITKSDSRTTLFGATSYPSQKSCCLWDKEAKDKLFAVTVNGATNVNFTNDTKVSVLNPVLAVTDGEQRFNFYANPDSNLI